MNKIIVGVLALGLTSSAHAETSIDKYIGAERNMDTEINSLFTGFGITTGDISISLETSFKDTVADNAKFNYTNSDLDIKWAMTPSASLYLKNDYDQDFKHEDTVIGVKVNF